MTTTRPTRRDQFEIAIICALRTEYDAVAYAFDEFWDENGDMYGRVLGDVNSYTTGRVGKYNVVLVCLPNMGKANASGAAASLRSSYSNISLALLVGVCGGVPQVEDDDETEILLGDVIVSKSIIQYDLGRQYPDQFVRKDTTWDNLSKPSKDVRNLLATLETDLGRERLSQRCAIFLKEIQQNTYRKKGKKYKYPGTDEDRLFEPSYRHKHRTDCSCICSDCHGRFDPVCSEAIESSCQQIGCDERYLVTRSRIQMRRELEQSGSDEAQVPTIHIGCIASGDTVMKSSEDRDKIARKEKVIAFEMEGAGIWEEVPCIVVKGVCDYADSHKNKVWQNFAAATAAATSKAILERYIKSDTTPQTFDLNALAAQLPDGQANPFAQYFKGTGPRTALHEAAQKGDVLTVTSLLGNGTDPELQDTRGYTALQIAVQKGKMDVVEGLLKYGAKPESHNVFLVKPPLHLAIIAGDIGIARLLLRNGAEVDAEDSTSRTPLQIAARAGQEDLVSLLLEEGANPNTRDTVGQTPLHWAALSSHEMVVQKLLEQGAKVDVRNDRGKTPLDFASIRQDSPIAKLMKTQTQQ